MKIYSEKFNQKLFLASNLNLYIKRFNENNSIHLLENLEVKK